MTVIAWDGKMLAADKQMNSDGHKQTVTKISRDGPNLIGTCGHAAHARAMVDWFVQGAIAEKWPMPHKPDDYADMLVIMASGQIREYEGCARGHYDIIEDPFTAMGCGKKYALAAMLLGHDAVKAVDVACELDAGCGMGIDKLYLRKQDET